MAFIRGDADAQHLTPQVITASEHITSDREMFALGAASPRNARILRRRSAWADVQVCVAFLFWLVLGYGAPTNRLQIVVLFDAYKSTFNAAMRT